MMSHLIILAYDPAAISIPSFGVNDIWSLLFKFAWVVYSVMTSWWRHHHNHKNQSRLSRDFSGACFESHSESNKLLQNNDRNITSVFRITWHSVTWWKRDDDVIVGVFVTWLWGHMIFRFILFWNVQIGRNSLVTSAYTCGGLRVKLQHFLRVV